MDYQVTVVEVDEHLIAAAKQRTTFKLVSKEIQELLGGPWSYLANHKELSPGKNVAIYWEDESDGSVEVGVEVCASFDPTDTVICSSTPAGKAATTVHWGSYDQLGAAHDAVRNWCDQNGYQTTPPFLEVYGHWDDDPEKVRTDIYYLLK